MEFRILGPIEVAHDGRELPLGGPKQRALLALLLLNANAVVSRDELIDGLWGERPPPSAGHTLEDYVSRLRKVLGADRIATRSSGYVLEVCPGELDVDEFERLLEEGRVEQARGDAAHALERLDAALALWCGRALADLLFQPFAQAEEARLEERRLLAFEELVDARLALGHAEDLIPELEQLVANQPWRERPVGQLMLALYRANRQSEALAAYAAARRRFAEELGLEPGPALRELERQILAHDPALARPRRVRDSDRVTRHGRLVAVGFAIVAACAAGAFALVRSSERNPPVHAVVTNELLRLDAGSASPVQAVSLSGAPSAIDSDESSLWLADPNGGAVSRVDRASYAVVERIALGGSPGSVAVGGGSVWVAGLPGGHVTRIDPATDSVTQTIGLGGARVAALAFGLGSLWIADSTDDTLIQVDPETGGVVGTIELDLSPSSLAFGPNAIWVADYDSRRLAEVDFPSGRTVATIGVGNGPTAIAVGGGAVWVANALDSTVSRIDAARGSVDLTIPVGSGPVALVTTPGAVWVASQFSDTITKLDTDNGAVVRTIAIGATPTSIAAAGATVWVAVRPNVRHRGGTLVLQHSSPLSIDPGDAAGLPSFQWSGLAYDGLVTFNHAAGPAGLQLLPDLAVSIPTPSDGGRTYTFRLRPGLRYSDGRLVRARDFRRSIERIFRRRSLYGDLLSGLVGAHQCTAVRCDLHAGVVTDDRARTIAFHLVAPDPGFLSNLTNDLSIPVPPGTAMQGTARNPIPGTGPYMVATADRRHVRFVRNPRFHEWSHAAQPDGNPDEIVWRFGRTPQQEVRAIEDGSADWIGDPVPGALLPDVKARFAASLHAYPTTDTEFLQLNTTLAPFDDQRVRRALNLALDRREIVRIYGGPEFADPACQLLPPGILGYRAYCPFTDNSDATGVWSGPDLLRARRLVAASGTSGAKITVWGWRNDPVAPVVERVASALRRLGYAARAQLVPHASLDNRPPPAFRNIQVIQSGWAAITPYDFVATWFSCNGAGDHAWFCDPALDRATARARALEATRPRQAGRIWSAIDRGLVDRAVLVPLVNARAIDFVSARVRNLQHHTYLGLVVDQVWLA